MAWLEKYVVLNLQFSGKARAWTLCAGLQLLDDVLRA
jgi:hypothetical protein